jgi:hypothetical protein
MRWERIANDERNKTQNQNDEKTKNNIFEIVL